MGELYAHELDTSFRLTVQQGESEVLVALHGELDLFAEHLVRPALASAWATGTSCVVIDLTRLTFLASSSVGCLLAAQETAEATGGQLLLRFGHPAAARTLELCGVLPRFAYMRSHETSASPR